MKYGIRTPCKDCPFRTDVPGYLRRSRAEQIVKGLSDPNGGEFPCHETMPWTDSPIAKAKVCAGSILTTERDQGPNQMHRISYRVNAYDPSIMNRDAPVFDSFEAFVEHHGARAPKARKLADKIDEKQIARRRREKKKTK